MSSAAMTAAGALTVRGSAMFFIAVSFLLVLRGVSIRVPVPVVRESGYALAKMMSSSRLPSWSAAESTFLNVNRVILPVAMYVPSYDSHCPVWSVSTFQDWAFRWFATLVAMILPTGPVLSPCPFDVTLTASCAVSLPVFRS